MALVSNTEFKYKLDIFNSKNRIMTSALIAVMQRSSIKQTQYKAAEFTVK
jgi:hypothetical protein